MVSADGACVLLSLYMVPLYISSFGPDPQQQIQQNNQHRLTVIFQLRKTERGKQSIFKLGQAKKRNSL